jgi:hypothetical protein
MFLTFLRTLCIPQILDGLNDRYYGHFLFFTNFDFLRALDCQITLFFLHEVQE